jgi:hypothetical protein
MHYTGSMKAYSSACSTYFARRSLHCFCAKATLSPTDYRMSGLDTYALVPSVPQSGNTNVKSNTKGEGAGEDGGHVDT